MFELGSIWKHKRWTDVAAFITECEKKPNGTLIKFMFLLRLPESTKYTPMNIKEWQLIPDECLKDWVGII